MILMGEILSLPRDSTHLGGANLFCRIPSFLCFLRLSSAKCPSATESSRRAGRPHFYEINSFLWSDTRFNSVFRLYRHHPTWMMRSLHDRLDQFVATCLSGSATFQGPLRRNGPWGTSVALPALRSPQIGIPRHKHASPFWRFPEHESRCSLRRDHPRRDRQFSHKRSLRQRLVSVGA